MAAVRDPDHSAEAHNAGSLNVLGGNTNEWIKEIADRFQEGLDLKSMLHNVRALIIGDTNHDSLNLKKGFISLLHDLKEAGVTHVAQEIPSDFKQSAAAETSEGTWIPHRHLQFFKTAEQLGLKVLYMDMPESMQKKFPNERMRSNARGKYMGQFLGKFLNEHPEATVAAFPGAAHVLLEDQIPEGLINAGLPFATAVGIVSGQSDMLCPVGRGHSSLNHPISVGVSIHTGGKSPLGQLYVNDITGNVDWVIHFPRPEIESVAVQAADLKTSSLSVPSAGESLLSPLSSISEPLHCDYSSCVDHVSLRRDKTNQHKIIDFVSRLVKSGSLNSSQGMYLASMLSAYFRANKEALKGSILHLGFNPEHQCVEVTTVDTWERPYDPKADYGASQRSREISLKTLQQHFGFESIAFSEIQDFSDVNISNNPEDPLSAIKIVPFVIAAKKDPDLIHVLASDFGSNPALKVCHTPDEPSSTTGIAVLRYTDFSLNPRERQMISLGEALDDLRNDITAFIYATAKGADVDDGDFKGLSTHHDNRVMTFLKRTASSNTRAYDALQQRGWKGRPLAWHSEKPVMPDRDILIARKGLREVSDQELSTLLDNVAEFMEGLDKEIEDGKQLIEWLGKNKDEEAVARGVKNYEAIVARKKTVDDLITSLKASISKPALGVSSDNE